MSLYQSPKITWGKGLLTLNSVLSMTGTFLADFNHTHVYNPNWPPHARFHNGQTMTSGLCLGAIVFYLTYRSNLTRLRTTPDPSTPEVPLTAALAHLDFERANLFAAAAVGTVYWLTSLLGIFFPGAAAVDPEFEFMFPVQWPFSKPFPQIRPFTTLALLTWLGFWLEARRIEKVREELIAKAKEGKRV